MSHSAAFKIFNVYYECMVANMHLVSDVEMDVYGSVTNDAATDRALAYENSVVLLSIVTIANYHNDGVSVTLVDPAKSKEIYETIHQHLMDWQNYLRNNVNIPDVPEADLKVLDNLAADILNTAKGYIKEPMTRPSFFKEPVRRAGRRMSRPDTTPVEEVQAQSVHHTHTPIADAIARANFKRRGGE